MYPPGDAEDMSTMLQDTTATRNSKLISPLATLYNSLYEGYAAYDGYDAFPLTRLLRADRLLLGGRVRYFLDSTSPNSFGSLRQSLLLRELALRALFPAPSQLEVW